MESINGSIEFTIIKVASAFCSVASSSRSSMWQHIIMFRLLAVVVPCLVQVCWAEPLWSSMCSDDHPAADLPFCDSNLDLEERVDDYVGRIPVEQQLAMMSHDASGYDPLAIPPYQWWSEGLHGPLEPCVDYQGDTKCPTSFACPSGLGNSFNTTLFRQIGAAVGLEGRAISQLRNHDMSIGDGLTYWSPNVNMQRDPRWGRNQEAPGEDPLLTSLYARNFVKGLQQPVNNSSNIGDNDRLNVGACCKHFVANSLEHWKGYSRHTFDAHISEADLQNYYFRPFRECVKAGAAGVMCSYNAVNGAPACLSHDLLRKTLRGEWGFDGYLVTDCGALADTIWGHGAAKYPVEASALAKAATVDVNCGNIFRKALIPAYQEGLIPKSIISDSFRRLAKIQFRLGLFDAKDFEPDQAIDLVGSHHELALESALQSIVLLKNQEGILPLDPNQKIAMVGPHIFGTAVFLSNYHGKVCPDNKTKKKNSAEDSSYACIETPAEAFSKISSHPIDAVVGCHVDDTDLNEIDKAVEIAKEADVVVVMVGLDQTQEREEYDRTETFLPGLQRDLVHSILDVASKKTIIVLIHGGAVSLGSDILSRAPGILSASYGGQMASQALAQVLYGFYNPTGKLAATMYPPSYVNDIPLTEMGLNVGVGRTHMYYSGTPEFAFGHGLSYSYWVIEWTASTTATTTTTTTTTTTNVESQLLVLDPSRSSLKLGINVTNLGPMKGSQTVLLFWSPITITENNKNGGGVRQKLADFKGTSLLDVGHSEVLEYEIGYEVFAMWNDDDNLGGSMVAAAGTYQLEARVSHDVSSTNSIAVVVLLEELSSSFGEVRTSLGRSV